MMTLLMTWMRAMSYAAYT